MTNDLNTVPATVLGLTNSAIEHVEVSHRDVLYHLQAITPLISKLCQPNIVIVDLDELRAELDKIPLGQEHSGRGSSEYNWGKYWIGKLAALKEKL